MRSGVAILSIALAILSTQRSSGQPNLLRIAFRYDPERVISYIDRLDDPVPITSRSLDSMESVPNPVAADGACGYLLRLTEARLRTFTPDPRKIPPLGKLMTLMLGGNSKVSATVDGYVEEWHGDPNVGVAILARISANELPRFRSATSDYFLISDVNSPALPPVVADPAGVEWKSRTTLNRFGALGEIVERTAEAGRGITLLREDRDRKSVV